LAADVEAGALLLDVRRHGAPPLGFDLRQPVPLARLRRVPDRDSHDLVPVRRVALVGAQHPLREVARLPGTRELLPRAGLQPPRREPDVCLVEVHQPASPRFWTNWKPKRPFTHSLPRVTSWSSGELPFTMSPAWTWSVRLQPTPQYGPIVSTC